MLCALLLPSLALADGTSVAVTPLRDSGIAAADVDRLEKTLIGELQGLGLQVVNAKAGKLFSPRKTSAEARFAEDPVARALALGTEQKAALALSLDAATFGDGFVLYLQGVDVAKSKAIASTAFSIGQGVVDHEAFAGALIRVLLPERYSGTLVVSADVPGAEVLVDGAAAQMNAPIPLSCSTHTLRVTHPAYREFLRFVTIDYGKPTRVEVALSKYPVDEGELKARQTAHKQAPVAVGGPLPWYQRWWALTLSAVILFAASAAITAEVAREGVAADRRISCCSQ